MGGRDKLTEPVGGVPLLAHMVRAACAVSAQVYVTLPAQGRFAAPRRAALAGSGAHMVAVTGAMAASLGAGVRALPRCDDFLVVLADMPGIGTAQMAQVIGARAQHPGAPVLRGAHGATPGHPVLFAAHLRDEFAQLRGDQGAGPLVARHGAVLVDIGPGALCDLDTPADWARWRQDQTL